MSNMITNIEEYVEDFANRAEELANKKLADCPKVDVRIKQVSDMLEQYYKDLGEYPKSKVLENLGSYIIVHELKNKDVDKVANTEYPIMSDIQLKRRNRKQVLMQDTTLDFLNTKYNKQIDSLARKAVKKAEY